MPEDRYFFSLNFNLEISANLNLKSLKQLILNSQLFEHRKSKDADYQILLLVVKSDCNFALNFFFFTLRKLYYENNRFRNLITKLTS
jgi:hypothetical protein